MATNDVVAGSLFTACGSKTSCLACEPAPHPPSFPCALLIQSNPFLTDASTFSGVLKVLIHFPSWLVSIPKIVFITQTWFTAGLLQQRAIVFSGSCFLPLKMIRPAINADDRDSNTFRLTNRSFMILGFWLALQQAFFEKGFW